MNKDRIRLLVLLGLLLIVAVFGLRNLISRSGGRGGESQAEAVRFQSHDLPVLESDLLTPVPGDGSGAGRNPFVYGAPPTPTRNLTPAPTLPPRPTRPPRPTPTPRFIMHNGQRLPPPPPFKWKFIGFFGPSRLTVAVFRNGDDIEVAVPGEVIDETFIVREVGLESVLIGFVGYPEEETTRASLEKK